MVNARASCPDYFVECFGYPREVPEETFKEFKEKGICPFVQSSEILRNLEDVKCIKIPHKLKKPIGACTVKYSNKNYIICPKRFLQELIIFKDIISIIKDEIKIWKNIYIIKEINIKGLGRVDYMLFDNDTEDFIGIEINALDTTGSLLDGSFGINTWHSAKLMLIQIIAKGSFFEAYGKKYFWIIQDTFFEDIENKLQWREKLSEKKGNIFVLSYTLQLTSQQIYKLKLNEILRGRLDDFISLFKGFTTRVSDISKENLIRVLKRRVSSKKATVLPSRFLFNQK